MMSTTMLDATMMVVIVVEILSMITFAGNVNASKNRIAIIE